MALKSALLDKMDRVMRRKDMTKATRKTYRHHCESFLKWSLWKFGAYREPKVMGREGLEAWLSDLANVKNVAATTQNGALQAALFLFLLRLCCFGLCANLQPLLRGLASRQSQTFTMGEHVGSASAEPGL